MSNNLLIRPAAIYDDNGIIHHTLIMKISLILKCVIYLFSRHVELCFGKLDQDKN